MGWRRTVAIGLLALGGPACGGSGRREAAEDAGRAASAPSLKTDAEVRSAFQRATGDVLDDRACIERPASFPDVVVVARYADPVGCVMTGAFVGGAWTTGEAIAIAGLATRGWESAAPAMREQLAWDWTREVVYAFAGTPIQSRPAAFAAVDTPEFTPPSTVTAPDGTTVVTTWIAEPVAAGATASGYAQFELRFSPAGGLTTDRRARFSVALPPGLP